MTSEKWKTSLSWTGVILRGVLRSGMTPVLRWVKVKRKGRIKTGECIYCGESRNLTSEHVPPQSMFGKPRPDNIVKVPSCYSCNGGFSKDDEYFQLMLKAGIDKTRFPKEAASSIDTINSSAEPRRLGFAVSVMSNYERNPARTHVDKNRIGAVLYRTIRGLYYHYTGVRLAQTVSFDFISISDSPKLASEYAATITELTERLNTIGDGVFRYAFQQELPMTLATTWLMTFYDDHKKFLCFITPAGRSDDVVGSLLRVIGAPRMAH
jgi:hypothetical protein